MSAGIIKQLIGRCSGSTSAGVLTAYVSQGPSTDGTMSDASHCICQHQGFAALIQHCQIRSITNVPRNVFFLALPHLKGDNPAPVLVRAICNSGRLIQALSHYCVAQGKVEGCLQLVVLHSHQVKQPWHACAMQNSKCRRMCRGMLLSTLTICHCQFDWMPSRLARFSSIRWYCLTIRQAARADTLIKCTAELHDTCHAPERGMQALLMLLLACCSMVWRRHADMQRRHAAPHGLCTGRERNAVKLKLL